MSTKQSTEATQEQQSSIVQMSALFENDAGSGMENIGRDEMAIPYISLIQKTSQAVDPTTPGYVEGAKIGQFLITGTNKCYNSLRIVPVHYKRQFAKYEDNDFRGYVDGSAVDQGIADGTITDAGRKLFDAQGFEYKDTRTHLVLILNDDGTSTVGIMNLASTQIKKSKFMLTEIQTFLETGASGKKFTPPSYAHVFLATSVAEKNDNGSWSGFKFTRQGYVESAEIYEKAKLLHDSANK